MTTIPCYTCFCNSQQKPDCQDCLDHNAEINKIPSNERLIIANKTAKDVLANLHNFISHDPRALALFNFSTSTENQSSSSQTMSTEATKKNTRSLSRNILFAKTSSKKRKRPVNNEGDVTTSSRKKIKQHNPFGSPFPEKIGNTPFFNDNNPVLEKISMPDRLELTSYLPDGLKFNNTSGFDLFSFLNHLIYTLLKKNIKPSNLHLHNQKIFEDNKHHINGMEKNKKIELRNKILSIKKYQGYFQIGQSIFYKVRPKFEGITDADYDYIINNLTAKEYTHAKLQRNENIKLYIEASIAIGFGYTVSETEKKFLQTKYSTFEASNNDHETFIEVLDEYIKTHKSDLYPHWHGHLSYL